MLIHCVFRQQSMLPFFWNPNFLLLCNFGNPAWVWFFKRLMGKSGILIKNHGNFFFFLRDHENRDHWTRLSSSSYSRWLDVDLAGIILPPRREMSSRARRLCVPFWISAVIPAPGFHPSKDHLALRGVSVSALPQNFHVRLGASAPELAPCPLNLAPVPPKQLCKRQESTPEKHTRHFKTQPWHFSSISIAKTLPAHATFPLPSLQSNKAPALSHASAKEEEKKSWQFNSNKRSLKSISTATLRLLANRILISMLLFFF